MAYPDFFKTLAMEPSAGILWLFSTSMKMSSMGGRVYSSQYDTRVKPTRKHVGMVRTDGLFHGMHIHAEGFKECKT